MKSLAAIPWKTMSTTPIYENRWLSLREDLVELPNGRTTIYGVVRCGECVGVLPFLDAETVLMVRQLPVRGRPDNLGDAHGRRPRRGDSGGGCPARAFGGDRLPGRPADSCQHVPHEQERHGRDRAPLPGRGDGEACASGGRDGIHRDP